MTDKFFRHYEAALTQLSQRDLVADTDLLVKELESASLVLITGIGTSYILALKFAHNLRSAGIRALALTVQDLAHGDMGIIDAKTTVVFLSKSGKTSEATSLISYVHSLGAQLHVVSESKPGINFNANWMEIGKSSESDKFGLTPSVSFAKMSIFLDFVNNRLVGDDSDFPNKFIKRHPAGTLGEKLATKIEEILRDVGDPLLFPGPGESHSLKLIDESFVTHQRGVVPFVDSTSKLVAVLTDSDLRRSRIAGEKLDSIDASFLDTYASFFPRKVRKDSTIAEALKLLMEPTEVSSLVVVDQLDQYVGIIHARDLLKLG